MVDGVDGKVCFGGSLVESCSKVLKRRFTLLLDGI